MNRFVEIGNNQVMFTIQSQGDVAEYVALNYDQVVAVRTFDHDGYVVVAVLTCPIFSQKERQDLLQSIKWTVAEELSLSTDKVIVSYDMELFRAMDQVSDEEKPLLLEMAMNRA